MRLKLILTLFCLGWMAAKADDIILLSKMDLSKVYQQYSGPSIGKSITGETVSVAGVSYTDAVCVHSKSIIKINLDRSSLRFRSRIGVADNNIDYNSPEISSIPLADGKRVFYRLNAQNKNFVGVEGENGKVDKGKVTFKIVGDGKEMYVKTMQAMDSAQEIDLNLKGVRVFELIVEDGGDGPSGDFAYWLASTFDYLEIPPVVVTSDFAGKVELMDPKVWQKLENKISKLKVLSLPIKSPDYDWLLKSENAKVEVYATTNGKGLILSNGLVARSFILTPNLATTDIINVMTGENMLRAVSSEGSLTIDGRTYSIGGLDGQTERGYIKPEWLDALTAIPNSFRVIDFEITPLTQTLAWKRERWALNKKDPTGKTLVFTLQGEGELAQARVKLYFDMYDYIPAYRKRMEVTNLSDIPFKLNEFKLELLAFAEPESPVELPREFLLPNISVESNYAFGGFTERESERTEKWIIDPEYTSQCNYAMKTPCILDVSVPIGPDIMISRENAFNSMDVYEMPYDSYDRERKGLFKRRFYRTVTPWVTENPIFLHLTSSEPEVVQRAIDQCAEVGYEMIILSFGSGVNMETKDPEHLAKLKAFADYAHGKGIELGGYSLLSSRWISDEVDVINPLTGKRGGMIFGSSPCLCSEWGYDYFDKIKSFFQKTGFNVFEHDGSYPGNVCASTSHKYHSGLNDSQWKQWEKITELYNWMRKEGIYMNVPDYYFLNGTNKVGIGYREVNWSLPRDHQFIHGRQVNYSGTFERCASSCWTFVPLVEYHGGGDAATLEPLNDHLDAYKMHMIQNYGAGVQACYRGPRLYDTERTKLMVKEVIDWYKQYRIILNSDIIHLRKADGRDWDGFMHVNPQGKEKGLALFFNPSNQEMVRIIKLPLYYTGITDQVKIRKREEKSTTYRLDRDFSVNLKVNIPANSYVWYVIE